MRLKWTIKEHHINWRLSVYEKSTWNASGAVTQPWQQNCKRWWPATVPDGKMPPFDCSRPRRGISLPSTQLRLG